MAYSGIRTIALLSVLLCACDRVERRTQVMLIVDADDEVRDRATDLRVRIEGATAGSAATAGEDYSAAFRPMAAGDTSWPYRFALVPKNGDATRRYRAVFTAYEGTKALAIVRTTSGFVKSKTLALRLRFDARCLGDESLRCTDTETCEAGACVPAGREPGSLPDLGNPSIDGGMVEPPEGGNGTITSGVGKAGAGGNAAAGSGGRSAAGSGGTSGAAGSAGKPVIQPGTGNCGDGLASEDEACDTAIAAGEPGACPTVCTSADACEASSLEGSGCQTRCAVAAITALVPDDGCCPAGADANGDPDCGASCGNGVVESGETCDPVASCSMAATCTPTDMCLIAVVSGDPTMCTASCRMDKIEACQSGDGCCPSICTSATDADCSASCGNGVVEPTARETCEPQSTERPCPTSCDDADACTVDLLTGSANNCNVNCVRLPILTPVAGDGCCPLGANANNDNDCPAKCGNGVTERGERCDASCPSAADCADADSCTIDALSGEGCARQCTHTRVTMVSTQSDGCCPPGGNANTDADCDAVCGNGVREDGELCDGNCPTEASCADNDPCTDDRVVGSGCARTCPHARVAPNLAAKDACCPSGANSTTDADCEPPMMTPVCGNGVVEAGEDCDGNCPACNATAMCTRAVSGGTRCNPTCEIVPIIVAANSDGCCPSSANANNDSDCEAQCGNGVTEPPGETCDATCPSEASCDDGDPCTRDGVTGGACNTMCTNVDMGRTGRDGCCHSGDDEFHDPDCRARCGNGQIETGEQCEGASDTCVDCQIVTPEPGQGQGQGP